MFRALLLSVLSVTFVACGTLRPDVIPNRVVRTDAVFEDYVPMLEYAGYNMCSYDISSFCDTVWRIKVEVREYEREKMIRSSFEGYTYFSNMTMISDFSEPDQERIIKEGSAYDPERGIYKLAGKLTVGLYPGSDESYQNLLVSVENQGSVRIRLPKRFLSFPRPVYGHEDGYYYGIRPFAIDEFRPGEYIPLVMYGSFWIDATGIARFCGEKELPFDMSSVMMKSMPHYYVIGITFSKE